MVTGEIECFSEKGITLKSGEGLAADIIVTVTGFMKVAAERFAAAYFSTKEKVIFLTNLVLPGAHFPW